MELLLYIATGVMVLLVRSPLIVITGVVFTSFQRRAKTTINCKNEFLAKFVVALKAKSGDEHLLAQT